MIRISNIQTYGWESAIRGMRNSRESWDKSESFGVHLSTEDLELAQRLAKLGGSYAKFRRMIGVSMDILAPIYWWKQFDTYKVGTVRNSTSTMYNIAKKPFTIDDFSYASMGFSSGQAGNHLIQTVRVLNELRDLYFTEEKRGMKLMYWHDMIETLPCSYNQLSTVSMNYEVISHMINERMYHKLNEWQEFSRVMLTTLPYASQLILDIEEAKKNGADTE